jgi:hypothetical protein
MTPPRRLKRAAVLFSLGLVSACAPQPAPPVITAAPPAPATPSPAMLHAAWLKGYDAGFANGERLQSQADAEVTAQATVPPPPHVAKPARPAAAPPASPAPAPIASAPPQSVFVPIGPAEPLNGAQ